MIGYYDVTHIGLLLASAGCIYIFLFLHIFSLLQFLEAVYGLNSCIDIPLTTCYFSLLRRFLLRIL